MSVLVGIALTVFAGLYMMKAFQRYAERKRLELQQDQGERARTIGYEKAVRSLEKRCPSCDKQWNLGGDDSTFCVHCGLRLFNVCGCGGRNFFFFRIAINVARRRVMSRRRHPTDGRCVRNTQGLDSVDAGLNPQVIPAVGTAATRPPETGRQTARLETREEPEKPAGVPRRAFTSNCLNDAYRAGFSNRFM